jgi:adenine deaminase
MTAQTFSSGGYVKKQLFALLIVLLVSATGLPAAAYVDPGSATATPPVKSVETIERQLAVQTALGNTQPTLVLRGATVLNAFTGRWNAYQDVVIAGKRIAYVGPVGSYTGVISPTTIVNLTGYFLVASFIESHNHIESVHLDPIGTAAILLPLGTTVNFEAGHELGNVLTAEQNREFWYAAEKADSPFTVYFQPGSAVAPTAYEHTAESNDYDTMMQLYAENIRTAGLDEVMDGPAWQNPKNAGYDRLWGAMAATWDSGRIVSGHLSGMYTPRDINAGAAAGLQNDHTPSLGDEALRKLEAGISLLLTPGNMVKNATYLKEIAKITDWSHVAYTTDDKAVNDILATGTMDAQARQLMAIGLDPADVYRMGSFYPATMWHVEKDFGSIAPGRYADIIVLRGPDVKKVDIYQVYAKGKLWAADGKLVKALPTITYPAWATTGAMKVRELQATDFEIQAPAGQDTVTAAILQQSWKGPLHTDYYTATLKVVNGVVQPDSTQRISQFCIVDRYNDLAQPVACMFWQFVGPKTPDTAVGFTVSHDHHNIQVMGNSPEALALAANQLRLTGGGYVVVSGGKVVDEVVLEVGGLMSTRPPVEVGKDFDDFWKAVAALQWFAIGDEKATTYDQTGLNLKRQIFATLTCTPWYWVLVAPFTEPVNCQSGFVNVQTGECHAVVW